MSLHSDLVRREGVVVSRLLGLFCIVNKIAGIYCTIACSKVTCETVDWAIMLACPVKIQYVMSVRTPCAICYHCPNLDWAVVMAALGWSQYKIGSKKNSKSSHSEMSIVWPRMGSILGCVLGPQGIIDCMSAILKTHIPIVVTGCCSHTSQNVISFWSTLWEMWISGRCVLIWKTSQVDSIFSKINTFVRLQLLLSFEANIDVTLVRAVGVAFVLTVPNLNSWFWLLFSAHFVRW